MSDKVKVIVDPKIIEKAKIDVMRLQSGQFDRRDGEHIVGLTLKAILDVLEAMNEK